MTQYRFKGTREVYIEPGCYFQANGHVFVHLDHSTFDLDLNEPSTKRSSGSLLRLAGFHFEIDGGCSFRQIQNGGAFLLEGGSAPHIKICGTQYFPIFRPKLTSIRSTDARVFRCDVDLVFERA
jgi:hypothetical protein